MFAKAEGSVWEADVLGEQDIAREPSAPGPSGEPGTLGFVGETDRAREPSTPGPSGEPWNHRTIIRRAIQDCFKGFLDLTVMPTLASLGWKYLLGFSAIPVLVFTLCSFKKRRQPSKENSTDIKSTYRMSLKNNGILMEVAKSVGYIYGGKVNGTCWRAGKDKIITAAHVVIGNIRNTVGNWGNEAELNKIYIDFNYVEHKQVKQEFKVEPRVIYINEILDVAVLQLKKHNSHEFPKALQMFHRLDRKKDLDRELFLISHDKDEPKEFNYNIGIWTPTERKMADLKKFSEDYYQENGYIGLDNSDRLVIQCDFVTGASGSPGITFINDTPFVVLIYLCGFPGFYYGANFPQIKKNKFPKDKLFQQGTCIGSFYDDLEGNEELCMLRREIFPHDVIGNLKGIMKWLETLVFRLWDISIQH